MTSLDKLTINARQNCPRILLPESTDDRVLKAALLIDEQRLAQVVLLGDKKRVNLKLSQLGSTENTSIEFIDSDDVLMQQDYAHTLYELRKSKGLSLEEATDFVKQGVVFAMLALQRGEVDGIVTGAITPSQQVLSNALKIVGVAPGSRLVSSFFLMLFDENHQKYGSEMLFSDCAMNINPSAENLAEIAKSTIRSANDLLGIKPKVAMLSFSTNKSAEHEQVEKVSQATSLCHKANLNADIVGNIQLDAALDNEVLNLKFPETSFVGPANVLIFPTLDAGNIGYKLVQRFSGADAVGPILQGLEKPVNDLSRGCSVDEIVNTVIITANQCA